MGQRIPQWWDSWLERRELMVQEKEHYVEPNLQKMWVELRVVWLGARPERELDVASECVWEH